MSAVLSTVPAWLLAVLAILFLTALAALVIGWLDRRRLSRSLESERRRSRQLTDQLHQARKMEAVGILAGNIAHNFNNLLSVINGNTRLVMGEVHRDSTQYRDLEQVLGAGQLGAELIKELSDFYGQADQQRKPVQAQTIVQDVLKLLRDILPPTVVINADIDPACGHVLASATQIQQLVMILCSNAYHAMRQHTGTIEIGLKEIQIDSWREAVPSNLEPGKYVQLSVRDDGRGMDRATLSHIFEPYFSARKDGTGLGLGLSTVYRILEDHDGATIPHSQPGQGTRFDIFFPVIAWSIESDEPPATTAVTVAPLGRARVLFVDDEPMVARVGKAGLEKLGYAVTIFTDGRQALTDFERQPDAYDVVITDQIMQHISGVKLARELIAIRSDLPVILATGFRESFNEQQARDLGIREFVVKPVSHFELARVIERVLVRQMEQKA